MTDQEQSRPLKVHLCFPGTLKPKSDAVLRVRVEDVSAADRPSHVVTEKVFRGLPGNNLEIAVPAGLIDRTANYSVFVHIDENGSGSIEKGDFISPEIHPVLTHGASDNVDVRLIKVGG